jgi:hypothetical protein
MEAEIEIDSASNSSQIRKIFSIKGIMPDRWSSKKEITARLNENIDL